MLETVMLMMASNSDTALPAALQVMQASAQAPAFTMTLANCEQTLPFEMIKAGLPYAGVSPAMTLRNYMAQKYLKYRNTEFDVSGSKTTILKQPQHGKLVFGSASYQFGDGYAYTPNPGYLGEDEVVSLLELNGKRYKIVTTIHVVLHINDGSEEFGGGMCTTVKRLSDVEHPPTKTITQSWPNSDEGNITISFSDIPGQSLGTTTETTTNTEITLVAVHPKGSPSK